MTVGCLLFADLSSFRTFISILVLILGHRSIQWTFYYQNITKFAILAIVLCADLGIDWIYCWNWFLALFIPLKISKYDFTIIWTSSKDKNFPKIWRMWLKNWVSYAHFNFELLKGVAALIFRPHPYNFNQVCIFYR